MGCCPPPPKITVADIAADEPSVGPEVERLPGEPEDCYMARRGNVSETGQVDDKTEAVGDRIVQNSVVPNENAAIQLQFTTTGPTAVTSWEMTPAGFTLAPAVPANLTDPVGYDSVTGLLKGTFDSSVRGQKLQLRVKAFNGASLIDDRTYLFSPSTYLAESAIQLLHPLPGSVITSGFGPRKPPASGASSQHMALDFAYPGGRTEDVICAADGEVVLARPGTGYGNYIMVKHSDASGRHLITTLYAHLDSMYVSVGQKVKGGQKLGKEGNTGIGSGPHLHFEVRLPNNTKVDPTPYLRGPVSASSAVTPNNQPSGGTVDATYAAGNRGITAAEVEARQGCPEYGPSYPPDPVAPPPPPAPSASDPFELAWYFVMMHEVNSEWMTSPDTSPLDPGLSPPSGNAVWQGLIDTPTNRKRVGFVNNPSDPGGATKFGIAQRFNPQVKVEDIDYPTTRQTGHSRYWLASLSPFPSCSVIATTSPRIAAMVFDMNYLLGPGGSRAVLMAAGITATETGAAELAALDAIYSARLVYLQARPGWNTFGRGWKKRADDCLSYCKSI